MTTPRMIGTWLAGQSGGKLLTLAISLGIVGLFPISIVDSSFVPLPIPGITDVMMVLFSARDPRFWHVLMLIAVATLGSALGGFFSYQVGHSGGLAFLEKHTPKRIFKQVTGWMESHAILAVAVPALLPPPMPLSPFVLAAGALKMSRPKFLWTFTLSRLLRHTLAAGLGLYFGPQVLVLWNKLMNRWGAVILIVLWSGILLSCGFAFYKLWQTKKSLGKQRSAAASA